MNKPHVLLLTHGGWGMSMVDGAKVIMGAIDCVTEIPLQPEMTFADYYAQVSEFANSMPKNSIILTDVFGGTTSNVAAKLGKDLGFKVLSGLNLPMLIELCTSIMYTESYNYDSVLSSGRTAVKEVVEEVMESLKKKVLEKEGETV